MHLESAGTFSEVSAAKRQTVLTIECIAWAHLCLECEMGEAMPFTGVFLSADEVQCAHSGHACASIHQWRLMQRYAHTPFHTASLCYAPCMRDECYGARFTDGPCFAPLQSPPQISQFLCRHMHLDLCAVVVLDCCQLLSTAFTAGFTSS